MDLLGVGCLQGPAVYQSLYTAPLFRWYPTESETDGCAYILKPLHVGRAIRARVPVGLPLDGRGTVALQRHTRPPRRQGGASRNAPFTLARRTTAHTSRCSAGGTPPGAFFRLSNRPPPPPPHKPSALRPLLMTMHVPPCAGGRSRLPPPPAPSTTHRQCAARIKGLTRERRQPLSTSRPMVPSLAPCPPTPTRARRARHARQQRKKKN